MQVRQIISLDRHDLANPHRIAEVFGLIGGFDLSEDQRKIFGRVDANAFTLEDILAIGEIIEAVERRPIPEVFDDERIQSVFAEGVRTNRAVARRMYDAFVAQLEDGLASADGAR